jgi:hypothetical protein
MPIVYTSKQPVDDFGLMFSDLKYSATLPATTDVTLTIPGYAQQYGLPPVYVTAPHYKAVIKSSNEVWISRQQALAQTNPPTALIPANPPAAPTGAALNPVNSELLEPYYVMCREVLPGDVLHFYAINADTDISVVLYIMDER